MSFFLLSFKSFLYILESSHMSHLFKFLRSLLKIENPLHCINIFTLIQILNHSNKIGGIFTFQVHSNFKFLSNNLKANILSINLSLESNCASL